MVLFIGLLPIERSADELPSVLDENITGTRLSPAVSQVKGARTNGRLNVLKPLNSSDQLTSCTQAPVQTPASHPTNRQTNPLSISGEGSS